jgi:hypothetical protein
VPTPKIPCLSDILFLTDGRSARVFFGFLPFFSVFSVGFTFLTGLRLFAVFCTVLTVFQVCTVFNGVGRVAVSFVVCTVLAV